jgi:hypothetical protein
LAALRAAAKSLPNLEWREVQAGRPDAQKPGTYLFDAWRQAIADIPPSRRAGIIVLSDGQVQDHPAADEVTGPIHLLLTGQHDEKDRRLQVLQAPRFGIVGEAATITIQVDDLGLKSGPKTAQVTVRRDGQDLIANSVEIGTPVPIKVPLIHAGPTVLEISVAQGPEELTLGNNRIVSTINAIRDRLRVLLISGTPYAGERVWRNLLKSDPSVDLVHFTILRPPTKQDFTPVGELSLIAFPVRQLFQEKLDDFDLIVFDRYSLSGLISPTYLENIANFARNGGAVLIAVGPDHPDRFASIHSSAIGDIMPAQPTNRVLEQGFRPIVTDVGQRHPVTRGLANRDSWGRWFRQIEAEAISGQMLMTGIDNKPLLVLDKVGPGDQKGRVAQILSDQIWLWARGFEGGGPHSELLRRLAHWLMKEPELDEEALAGRAEGGNLVIERNTIGDRAPTVRVTEPNGSVKPVQLSASGQGRFSASVATNDDGLYQIDDGLNRIMVLVNAFDAKELLDPRANPQPLAQTVEASAGSVHWIADGTPMLRQVQPNRSSDGQNWIGLQQNNAYSVTGLAQIPLIPAWLSLIISAFLLVFGWWRETR